MHSNKQEQGKKLRYIFGPVHSWRLGISLGIDPVSQENKICNFNCVYCQLGETSKSEIERKEYVQTKDIIRELKTLPDVHIDYITFTSRGEPTLAKNLGEMILAVREIRQEKIAVITNSVLIPREDVQADISLADVVIAKLDACDQESLQQINRALHDVDFWHIVEGLQKFRQRFYGILALQIMFIDENKAYAQRLADIARTIAPDKVEINTPLRPSNVSPLSKEALEDIKQSFTGLPVKTVFEGQHKHIDPLDLAMTEQRHGHYEQ